MPSTAQDIYQYDEVTFVRDNRSISSPRLGDDPVMIHPNIRFQIPEYRSA